MKHGLILGAAFMAACSPEPTSTTPEPVPQTQGVSSPYLEPSGTLAILSWNIANLAGEPGTALRGGHIRNQDDYTELRTVIASFDPDVIALQEIGSVAATNRILDTAMYDVKFETRCLSNQFQCRADTGDIYTAIAYKKDLTGAKPFQIDTLAIDHTSECNISRPARGGVGVEFIHNGKVYHVPSVHMEASCKDDKTEAGTQDVCDTQSAQFKALSDWMNAIPAENVIIVSGDFNRKLLRGTDSTRQMLDKNASSSLQYLPSSTSRSCFSDQDFRYNFAELKSQARINNPKIDEQNEEPFIYTPKSNQAIDFFVVRGLDPLNDANADQIELPSLYRLENPGDTLTACNGEDIITFENDDRAMVFAEAYPSDHCPITLTLGRNEPSSLILSPSSPSSKALVY